MDQKYQNAQQQGSSDPFGHPDQDAAIGLYSLAQANGRMVPQNAMPANMGQMGNVGSQAQETSPISKRGAKNSIDSVSAETGDLSDSGQSEDTKPTTRSTRGKKAANAKGSNSGRRKADDTPAKGTANKRAKGNSGAVMTDDMMDDESSPKADDDPSKNRKMTDEEKRKNFLERNRYVITANNVLCRHRY
jgi:ATF/CREB family transcription factor